MIFKTNSNVLQQMFQSDYKKYLESYENYLKTFSCNFFQDHLNYFPLSFFE